MYGTVLDLDLLIATTGITVVMPLVLRWRRWIRSGGGYGSESRIIRLFRDSPLRSHSSKDLRVRSGLIRSCAEAAAGEYVFKHTHNQQLVPLLRFLEPTLHSLVSAAIFRGISALLTLADGPTEFSADRGSLTHFAPARRGASVNFFRHLAAPDLVNGGASLEFSGIGNRLLLYIPALRRVGF